MLTHLKYITSKFMTLANAFCTLVLVCQQSACSTSLPPLMSLATRLLGMLITIGRLAMTKKAKKMATMVM